MLSRTAEYAVRAVVLLARQHDERALRADEIADRLGAPRNYLSKTLNALARSGVLSSARGPGGGFALAMPPEQLSIADIIDVFADEQPVIARCLLGDAPCDASHPCAAHRRWSAITIQAREPLLRTTIAQLCGEVPTRVPSADHDDALAAITWPETHKRTDPCP
jgi:Rrf2 family protein